MIGPHYHPFLVIALIAVLAPLVTELPHRIRIPSVVLEIICGVVVGPQVLGWVQADAAMETLWLPILRDACELHDEEGGRGANCFAIKVRNDRPGGSRRDQHGAPRCRQRVISDGTYASVRATRRPTG